MDAWLLAIAVLYVLLCTNIMLCAWGTMLEAIVAVEMASAATVVIVAIAAVSIGRSSWLDLALGLGLLAFPSGMVFLIFMEPWL
jgi:multicomponent Na+:H+ antiporter subunit F